MPSFETSAELRRLLDALPSLVGYWDKECRCRYANRAYEVWLGVGPGELLGRHVDDFIIPSHREKLRLRFEAVFRGEPQHYVRALEWPNFSGSGQVDLIPNLVQGQVQGFFVHVTDSSSTTTLKLMALREAQSLALQQSHAQLTTSESALRRAQRLGRIGSWECDLASDTWAWSDGMFLLYGLEPARALPAVAFRKALYTAEGWRNLRTALRRAATTGEPFLQEAEIVLPMGQRGWYEMRGAAERGLDGAIVSLRGTVQDITERKLLELARLARQLEERANSNKSVFLARMSHELRTPLNAVLGFSQLLELDGAIRTSPGTVEKIGHIRVAAKHLLSMVDDLLDISQIESGALRVTSEPVSVDSLLVDCLGWVSGLADHHRVSVTQLPPSEGLSVIGDRTRLRQVLVNLLTNGIKYNREGGSVEIEQSVDAGQLAIAVRDTGQGLTSVQVDALFQPFNRLGAERGHIEGVGLGLVIAKHLAEQMQGSLAVDTRVGQGSVFTLRLPLSTGASKVDRGSDPAGAAHGGEGLADANMAGGVSAGSIDADDSPHPGAVRRFTVLYIEDNRLNAALMRHAMAQRQGVTLELAVDGQAGLEAARRLIPDLLLLDMGLPLISGPLVLEQLRADPVLAEIPCVAISANAMQADIQRALDAGCCDYITKPYSIDRVLDWVDRLRG